MSSLPNAAQWAKRSPSPPAPTCEKSRAISSEIELPFETFDAVIVAEDVVHKKPSPEIFLAAAKRIGLDPKDCLVIEDAVSGVEAAKAAGAKCLAITSSFSKEKLAKADWFAPDLSAVR